MFFFLSPDSSLRSRGCLCRCRAKACVVSSFCCVALLCSSWSSVHFLQGEVSVPLLFAEIPHFEGAPPVGLPPRAVLHIVVLVLVLVAKIFRKSVVEAGIGVVVGNDPVLPPAGLVRGALLAAAPPAKADQQQGQKGEDTVGGHRWDTDRAGELVDGVVAEVTALLVVVACRNRPRRFGCCFCHYHHHRRRTRVGNRRSFRRIGAGVCRWRFRRSGDGHRRRGHLRRGIDRGCRRNDSRYGSRYGSRNDSRKGSRDSSRDSSWDSSRDSSRDSTRDSTRDSHIGIHVFFTGIRIRFLSFFPLLDLLVDGFFDLLDLLVDEFLFFFGFRNHDVHLARLEDFPVVFAFAFGLSLFLSDFAVVAFQEISDLLLGQVLEGRVRRGIFRITGIVVPVVRAGWKRCCCRFC
mmetsp:Transcript_9987/g.22703  ORF Transcript_9987/g.22703 Transcript_9987/m.22703 type:complete len:405 (+) Transcript_9987:198-1412(+)